MSAPLAFIWDLDGTLLDSYDVIVDSMYRTYQDFGIELDKEMIRREAIRTSVSALILKLEEETGLPFAKVKPIYSAYGDQEKLGILPMKNAQEILRFLKEHGHTNYVFTHRGVSTEPVLKNTGLYEYFDDIVTGRDGFERKPDPEAIHYLVHKHRLDPERTFYVGDRTIDIECADNAGIKSILYLPEGSVTTPTGKETYIVHDLREIGELALHDA